jgi:hypothetical protein
MTQKWKKIICLMVFIAFCSCIISCGNTKKIDKYTYDTYGFFNAGEKKNPNIEYQIIIGNVIWGIILCETIIAPIYFFGFSLYEPIGLKNPNTPKGSIGG